MKTSKVTPIIKATQLIEELRKLDAEMPIQTAAAYLEVANREGQTMSEIAKTLGLAQSSCSRNISALSKRHRHGKAGLDLVIATEDPDERRRKIVRLTAKGKRVLKTIELLMA